MRFPPGIVLTMLSRKSKRFLLAFSESGGIFAVILFRGFPMRTLIAITMLAAGCSGPKDTEAFREGQLAGEAELDRKHNPYYDRYETREEHRDWNRGYNDGIATKKILDKPKTTHKE